MEVGDGFQALGAVLWTALSHCQAENDVHNASVIMMLSQVRNIVLFGLFFFFFLFKSSFHLKKKIIYILF